MSVPKFTRTAKAAQADRLSRWDLIAAIAEDAADAGFAISGAESVVAAKSALTAAGNEYSDSTVRHLCVTAKFDHESTPAQRKVWRTYGWTTVKEAVMAGWSQESVLELLAGNHKTQAEVRQAVSSSKVVNDPDPLDDRWGQWVHRMNALLMDGARLAEESEEPTVTLGGHSAMGLAIYRNLIEREFDREVRRLLETEATA